MQDYRNNQCASMHTRSARTIDEAKLMANVNARAQRLFQDDYTGRRLTASTVRVFSPHGEQYLVDQASAECDCPFFTKHLGKYPCKHILGADKLLSDQKAAQAHNIREWAGMAGVNTHRAGMRAPLAGMRAPQAGVSTHRALTETSGGCRTEHIAGGGLWK